MKIKKYIQFLFFICLTLIFVKPCLSQMTVDAGKDTTYCTGLNIGTLFLGKNVTIINGVEPYSYKWECKVELSPTLIFTASDFLNDTTIATPYFKDIFNSQEWVKFTLHVMDSNNNYKKDSIRIRFSRFGYLLGYQVIELEESDSILFKDANIGGGIDPLRFYWQPRTGLSNPDTLVTWCKPDSSTQYNVVAIDSCGCVSYPNLVYDVRVLQTGFNDLNLKKDNTLNIRQSKSRIYFNNPLTKEAHITLYSINGGARHNFRTTEDYFETTSLLKNKGIYIVKISVGDFTSSKKYIKF